MTNKILIIGPAWVGDLVMAQVLFKLLQQQNPGVTIDVMAPVWGRALLERMPEVNQVWELPFGHGVFALKERWQLGVKLRAQKYQQAIVLPNSWKSALIPFAAGIPQRTGWCGEMRYGLLNDIRYLDKKALPLMIQRFAALGLAKNAALPVELPRPALKVSAASITETGNKFKITKSDQPVIVLCPGAEFGPAKRWPTEYYAAVAKQQIAAGAAIWLLGSAKDQPVAAEIQQATQNACVDFTGRTTLGEAVDLIAQANLVVANDSGLMHIAASLARPLVVIYGSSSPKFTPPLADQVKILTLKLPCQPCFQRTCPLHHLKCLRDLAPVLVNTAISELL